MKRLFVLCLLAACCYLPGKWVHSMRQGFSVRRIQNSAHAHPQLEEETKKILSQTFHYLGRGRQCFAFSSDDGRYVLKVLRTDIYHKPFWARLFPTLSKAKKSWKNRGTRYQFVCNSFRLSRDELADQTGVIYLQMGKHDPIRTAVKQSALAVHLIDAMGVSYHVPIETMTFALQKKHPIWTKALLQAIQDKDITKSDAIVGSLIDTVVERGKKGILNKDASFLRNYGFDGSKTFQIDIGSFYRFPEWSVEASQRKSVRDSLIPVYEWLSKTDPETASRMQPQFDRAIHGW